MAIAMIVDLRSSSLTDRPLFFVKRRRNRVKGETGFLWNRRLTVWPPAMPASGRAARFGHAVAQPRR